MREKEGYRPALEMIRERYGDRQWLRVKDVAEYMGLCYNTVKKRYPRIIEQRGCTQTELARMLSN